MYYCLEESRPESAHRATYSARTPREVRSWFELIESHARALSPSFQAGSNEADLLRFGGELYRVPRHVIASNAAEEIGRLVFIVWVVLMKPRERMRTSVHHLHESTFLVCVSCSCEAPELR